MKYLLIFINFDHAVVIAENPERFRLLCLGYKNLGTINTRGYQGLCFKLIVFNLSF